MNAWKTATLVHRLCLSMALLTLALPRPISAQSLPLPLAVGDSTVLLEARAIGVQIYTCKAIPRVGEAPQTYEWVFKAPEADLTDRGGNKIGRHYAGPAWDLFDGSKVVGTPLASVSSPGNIPWLLLAAKSTTGPGLFSVVTYVERAFTVGGTAPQSGADAAHLGTQVRVPYAATYIFYGHIYPSLPPGEPRKAHH